MGRHRGLIALLGMFVAVGAAHRDEAAAGQLAPPPSGPLQVLITTSELVVGENRFAFGLLKNDTLLEGARVLVRIYDVRE